MNDVVKSKTKCKNLLCKVYTKNGYKYNDYLQLQEARIVVSGNCYKKASLSWYHSFKVK